MRKHSTGRAWSWSVTKIPNISAICGGKETYLQLCEAIQPKKQRPGARGPNGKGTQIRPDRWTGRCADQQGRPNPRRVSRLTRGSFYAVLATIGTGEADSNKRVRNSDKETRTVAGSRGEQRLTDDDAKKDDDTNYIVGWGHESAVRRMIVIKGPLISTYQ